MSEGEFLCFNKVKGEDLAPVKAFKPPEVQAAVHSKVMLLLLLIHCLLLFSWLSVFCA